jgi:predicted O-methyltransferase YrrM
MMAELEIGYPVLKPGGIVVIDDVERHDAMSEFCEANNVDTSFIARGVGYFSKPQ